MRRLPGIVAPLLVSAMLGESTGVVFGQQENVLDVGSRSQLLLDPALVYEAKNVSFTPHTARKHPHNPLVRADTPGEGWYVSIFGGTVLFDAGEKRFRMWYHAPGSSKIFDGSGKREAGSYYATSKDGLAWEKPPVGTVPSKTGAPHNRIANVLHLSVFPDPAGGGFRAVAYDADMGYVAITSPDGFRWERQGDEPIVPISYTEDVVTAFRDRRTGAYVALPKMSTPVFGRLRRTIYLSQSFDFRHWTRPEVAFASDRRDDLGSLARVERSRPLLSHPDNMSVMRTEFYGAAAYSGESAVVGFPFVFTASANVPGKGNQEGPIEVQFAFSRDLESWHRPFRTPAVELGRPGEWDGGMILTASQAIDVGDEVWLYYGGTNYTHGAAVLYDAAAPGKGTRLTSAIGLATWKRDRFASADGPASGGTLTTVPLTFSGKRLELNCVVKDRGEVRVELLDPAGRPIEGIGMSDPVVGDSLSHSVTFAGTPDLAKLAGKPVCLRFHLRDAELYAFAFRPM